MKATSLILTRTLSALLLIFIVQTAKSQDTSAGINVDNPNPNAVLHLVSPGNNQGLLIPTLTTAQRTGMTLGAVDDGLLVYDSSLKAYFLWADGTGWLQIANTNQTNLANILAADNDAGSSIISNVANPVSPQDVATKDYVDIQADSDNQSLTNVLGVNNGAGNNNIKDLAEPVDSQDAATKNYVDSQGDSDNQDLTSVLGFGNNAGNNTIEGVLDPINPSDVATKNYVDTQGDSDNQDLTNVLGVSNDAGANAIVNVANPVNPQDVATKNYVDGRGDSDNQDLSNVLSIGNDAGANAIVNVTDPTNPQDVATKNYVDSQVGVVPANAVNSGSITDGSIANVDVSGTANIDWSKINKIGAAVSELTNDAGFIASETDPVWLADRATLGTVGVINTGSNLVDWSQLKGVPAAFSDGTDDIGGDMFASIYDPGGVAGDAFFFDTHTSFTVPADGDLLTWDNTNGRWDAIAPAVTGDMFASIYDPGGVAGDAFLFDTHTSFTAPADGDLLTWDNTNGRWDAIAPAVTGDMFASIYDPGGVAGDAFLFDTHTSFTAPADGDLLTWDNTNGRWDAAAQTTILSPGNGITFNTNNIDLGGVLASTAIITTGAGVDLQINGAGNLDVDATSDFSAQATFSNIAVTGGSIAGAAVSQADNNLSLIDDVDGTKVAQFEVSGISTATLRTFTLPDSDGTLALDADITALSSLIDNPGTENLVAGFAAGSAITSGINNVMAGENSGSGVTTGGNNVLVGRNAAFGLVGGSSNTIIGSGANVDAGGVAQGTAVGFNSTVGGQRATAVGDATQATANDAIAIGHGAQATADGAIAIGDNATAALTNTIVLGNNTDAYKVGIGTNNPMATLQIGSNFGLAHFENATETINGEMIANNVYPDYTNVSDNDLRRLDGSPGGFMFFDDANISFLRATGGVANSIVDLNADTDTWINLNDDGSIDLTPFDAAVVGNNGADLNLEGGDAFTPAGTGNGGNINLIPGVDGGGGGIPGAIQVQGDFIIQGDGSFARPIIFEDGDGLQEVDLRVPDNLTNAYSLILPNDQGTGTLTNDGLGNLSWTTGGLVLPYSQFVSNGSSLFTLDNDAAPAATFINSFNNVALEVQGHLAFIEGNDRDITINQNLTGPGNNLNIMAGGAGGAGNDNGGSLSLQAGNGVNSGNGGDVVLNPGIGNTNGLIRANGDIQLFEGFNRTISIANNGTAAGNMLDIAAGSTTNAASTGGILNLRGGDGNGANGGNIRLEPGNGTNRGGIDMRGITRFGQVSVLLPGAIELEDNTGTNAVEIRAAGSFASYTLTLPTAQGAIGQSLITTDAAGTLDWTTTGFTYDTNGNSVGGNGGTGLGGGGGTNNVVIGTIAGNNLTSATDNIVIGRNAGTGVSLAADNILIGRNANSTSSIENIAIGRSATADGGTSIAIGRLTTSLANGISIGGQAAANNAGNIAIGQVTTIAAGATNAVALGAGITVPAAATDAIGIGNGAVISSANAIAIGNGASAGANNATAIGAGTNATVANTIILGDGPAGYNVGVGTDTPAGRLGVSHNGATAGISANQTGGGSVALFSVTNTGSTVPALEVRSDGAVGSYLARFDRVVASAGDGVIIDMNSVNNPGLIISGTTQPIRITNGALNGYVLTSDASGNGTWGPQFGTTINTTNYLVSTAATTNVAGTSNNLLLGTSSNISGGNANILMGPGSNNGVGATSNNIAIGTGTVATGGSAVAIGNAAQANVNNSIAIGSGTVANTPNTIVLGDSDDNLNVGIGTDSPVGKFGISQTGSADAINISRNSVSAGNGVFIDMNSAGTGAAIRVNNSSGPSIDVDGEVRMAGNLVTVPDAGGPYTGPAVVPSNARIVSITNGAPITDIAAGIEGQELILVCVAAAVDVNHNNGAPTTNIILDQSGAANFTMNPNSTLHLIYFGGVWLEVGRNAQ